MKIVQALEDSNILLKGVTTTIKNETKEQKGGFLSMLLGTLGASLLGNLLSGKGLTRAGYGNPSKKKEKDSEELAMVIIHKIRWIFNTASSFNKLWNTKILWQWI